MIEWPGTDSWGERKILLNYDGFLLLLLFCFLVVDYINSTALCGYWIRIQNKECDTGTSIPVFYFVILTYVDTKPIILQSVSNNGVQTINLQKKPTKYFDSFSCSFWWQKDDDGDGCTHKFFKLDNIQYDRLYNNVCYPCHRLVQFIFTDWNGLCRFRV